MAEPRSRFLAMAICLVALCAGVAQAGEARCWLDNGAVVVPATYGPITGDFILDLSQTASQLHETAAQAAGWSENSARSTLRLAGRAKHGFPMRVTDLDVRVARFPTNIAGILGADVLGGLTLDLDLAPCRLRLARSGRKTVRHPVTRLVAGTPTVFAAISDGVTARTGWFSVDTASTGARIADAGFSRPLPKAADANDRARPPGRLRAVSVAGQLLEQTPAGVMAPAAPGLAGSLGTWVWARVHLHIDGRVLSARR
jgi:hypothetical protein